jgi:hypothetical protein
MLKTSVSDILMHLSYELDALAAATDEFHNLAFGQDGTAASMSAGFVSATQRIDLSQQILANLSDFVAGVALALPKTLIVDLEEPLSLITLSDLKYRLRGQNDDLMSAVSTTLRQNSEIELF